MNFYYCDICGEKIELPSTRILYLCKGCDKNKGSLDIGYGVHPDKGSFFRTEEFVIYQSPDRILSFMDTRVKIDLKHLMIEKI